MKTYVSHIVVVYVMAAATPPAPVENSNLRYFHEFDRNAAVFFHIEAHHPGEVCILPVVHLDGLGHIERNPIVELELGERGGGVRKVERKSHM